MELPMEIDEQEDITQVKKTRKTNRSKIDEEVSKRSVKGIILSVTKPSYTLKSGIGRDFRSLRWEHRNKLRYLLRQLVRRQNWDEASGVLSVLLKGTHKENCLSTNRNKYWAALELLEHMGVIKVKPRKVQHVYEIWMKKNFAATKNKPSLKGSFDVQLEFLLFCLSQGDTDGAYQTVISLQQESNFMSDPKANLVAGLAYSKLWYDAIQKEMQLHDLLDSSSPIQSGMSEHQDNITFDPSNGQGIVKVQDSDSSHQQESNTSIRIGKETDVEVLNHEREVPMEVDINIKREIPEYKESCMNSIESDQTGNPPLFPYTGNKHYSSIFYASDIEYFLVPLKLPRTNRSEDFISLQGIIHNDHYKAAVKHLSCALRSTPPAFEALLPLIQMLLVGDQVKEAIEEVESVVQNSNATLPFRLKATLLEHFSKEDAKDMCICYEDTLRTDPTCSHSLAKLIGLHHDGLYSLAKVIEMIGLHLDATYADCHIWKEFASCFIRLSQCDDDRMSSCGGEDSYQNRSMTTPDMFKDGASRKNWKLRCRWWLTRHFTQTILASEVASGNTELIAYKAASACHLYGPELVYVVKAYEYLKNGKYRERSILKMHMENAIRLYSCIT